MDRLVWCVLCLLLIVDVLPVLCLIEKQPSATSQNQSIGTPISSHRITFDTGWTGVLTTSSPSYTNTTSITLNNVNRVLSKSISVQSPTTVIPINSIQHWSVFNDTGKVNNSSNGVLDLSTLHSTTSPVWFPPALLRKLSIKVPSSSIISSDTNVRIDKTNDCNLNSSDSECVATVPTESIGVPLLTNKDKTPQQTANKSGINYGKLNQTEQSDQHWWTQQQVNARVHEVPANILGTTGDGGQDGTNSRNSASSDRYLSLKPQSTSSMLSTYTAWTSELISHPNHSAHQDKQRQSESDPLPPLTDTTAEAKTVAQSTPTTSAIDKTLPVLSNRLRAPNDSLSNLNVDSLVLFVKPNDGGNKSNTNSNSSNYRDNNSISDHHRMNSSNFNVVPTEHNQINYSVINSSGSGWITKRTKWVPHDTNSGHYMTTNDIYKSSINKSGGKKDAATQPTSTSTLKGRPCID